MEFLSMCASVCVHVRARVCVSGKNDDRTDTGTYISTEKVIPHY